MNPNPLNIHSKRCVINGVMMNIMTYDDYAKSSQLADSSTGIEKKTTSGKTIVLPYKGKLQRNISAPNIPGVYDIGPADIVIMPSAEEEDDYVPNKIIEFDNTDNIKKILESQAQLSKLAEPWITNPDNITFVSISESDRPEVVGLKTAINEKHIDIDKYASRFGENFPNDKRQLRNESLTLKMVERFANNLDMEAVLIFRDKNPNVPNPIGREISVSLTDGYINDDEDE
jgi:hypothetical protein